MRKYWQNDKNQAINTNASFQSGADMSFKEQEILTDIVSKTNFEPEEAIWRSSYWGTNQIGAVHYRGKFKGKTAVLKIQGVKSAVSEIYMIGEFEKQNKSKIIRPPKLFSTIPWSDENGYEALIMEHISGPKVLESKKLQTRENIKTFLDLYQEYRLNCLPKKAWLPKPNTNNLEKILKNLIETSQKAYPNDPRRLPTDEGLAKQAYGLLEKIYKDTPLEFVHGHISVEDLICQGDEVILFSNLFWRWRFPFYDAVLGYHWFIFELSQVLDITPVTIEEQRNIWLSELLSLSWVQESREHLKLAKAALLERSVAGFIIDSFLTDPSKQIAKYLTNSTREQAKKLMSELSE